MSTINDSQQVTVVTKNFVLHVTGVLHAREIVLKLLLATVLIRPYTLSFSAVQSNTIALKQRFMHSCFDVIVLTFRRRNAESV